MKATTATAEKRSVLALGREVYDAAIQMKEAGIADAFIIRSMALALDNEGIADLFVIWTEATNDEERGEIIADLQDHIEESDDEYTKLPKVRYTELEEVSSSIMEFKQKLKRKVEDWGGINKLAKATGIPQPSLSRFFNVASMPRRTTLLKIAAAMDLSQKDIATPWSK